MLGHVGAFALRGEAHNLLKGFSGLLVLPRFEIELTQLEVGIQKSGNQDRRLAKRTNSQVGLFPVPVGQPQIVVGQAEIRFHADGLPVIFNCLVKIAFLVIRPAEVVVDEKGGEVKDIIED